MLARGALTGRTGVSPVPWTVHVRLLQRTRRPLSQLARRMSPRWRKGERLVAEKRRNGPAVCTKRACHLPPMGLPSVPCEPATCTRWACHWYPVGLPFAPNGRPISELSGYGLAVSRQRVQGRTAEILKIFRNPSQLQNVWQSGRRWNAVPTAFARPQGGARRLAEPPPRACPHGSSSRARQYHSGS